MRGFLFALFIGLGGSWAVAQDDPGWAIVDAAKGLPIEAALALELPERPKPIESESAGFHGLPSGVVGTVHALVLKPQFLLHSQEYDVPFAGTDTIALHPLQAGLRMDLPRVLFVEASFRLDYHSLVTLEYLVQFLALNPTTELAISCSVAGKDAVDCQRLGRQRARSVWEYLVTEGVTPTRLTLEGRCSEEEEPRIAFEVRSI